VDYQGQYNRDETTQHHFNLQFKTRPDRFYILGMSQGNYREIDTTTETLQATEDFDSANSPVRTKESIRERPELRINLQIAKRWYNAQLRFGMFESTGGMAADFFLFKDKLKYTVEVFDFAGKYDNTRAVARVRTYLSMLFFDHIYLVAGVDDATRKDPNTGKVSDKPNAFIGAGMNFNDDDLKALFGAASLVSR
jgi:phospholipid/cholesterol/gamma-HCH transport system substrate-binding protein